MRSERVSYKLDQLGFVGRGKSKHRPRNDPSLYGGDYPFFQTGDVKGAELYLRCFSATYNEKGLAQSKLWQPGTLCITIAANIADSSILSIPGCFPDSVVGFVADPQRSDVFFVKYYLDTLKNAMQSISHGTTQDNLSLEKLLSFDFWVPSVEEQRKIASVLLAYDNLIENNTRRIEILEEMARRLYEEWFVQFRFPGHEGVVFEDDVPQGWSRVRLDSVAEVNPEAISPKNAPDEIMYVDISSVSTRQVNKLQRLEFSEAPGRARRKVISGDVVWSCVRPALRSYALIIDPPPNTIVSTGFAVVRADSVPFSYLYQVLGSDQFVSYLDNHATGAAYPAVKASDFEVAEVVLPCKNLLAQFDGAVLPMLKMIHVLRLKNNNLQSQRDLLLPKLISGEIDVSDIPMPT
ncbi:restriction endonuclease subunit S [Stutzerimonas xanthomarina]|nr:restriction endonuclease subunit S [Stutzerimonas xanthomarina]